MPKQQPGQRELRASCRSNLVRCRQDLHYSSPEEPDQERATGDIGDAEKKPEESSQEAQLASTPEERRHSQRERLNQILLNLLEKIPGKNGKTRAHN